MLIKNDEKDLIIGFIISALSLVAATNLNSTMEKVFNHYIEDPGYNLRANIIYTTVVVLISAFSIVYITRYLK